MGFVDNNIQDVIKLNHLREISTNLLNKRKTEF